MSSLIITNMYNAEIALLRGQYDRHGDMRLPAIWETKGASMKRPIKCNKHTQEDIIKDFWSRTYNERWQQLNENFKSERGVKRGERGEWIQVHTKKSENRKQGQQRGRRWWEEPATLRNSEGNCNEHRCLQSSKWDLVLRKPGSSSVSGLLSCLLTSDACNKVKPTLLPLLRSGTVSSV